MKKVKVILDANRFIAWRFKEDKDFRDLADDIIYKLLKHKKPVTVSLEEIAIGTGYMPLSLITNIEEIMHNNKRDRIK